jgi:hypothetical protein
MLDHPEKRDVDRGASVLVLAASGCAVALSQLTDQDHFPERFRHAGT